MIPAWWLLATRGLSLVIAAWSVLATGLRLTFGPEGFTLLGLLAMLWFMSRFLRGPQGSWRQVSSDLAGYMEVITFLCLVGSVTSYAAAAASQGFVDPTLARWDQAIGFDWRAAYHAVSEQRTLQAIGRFAYRSIYASPLLLFGYFAWTRQKMEARRLVFALWLALNGCILGMWFAPTMGPFAFLHGTAGLYQPIYSDEPFRLIEALRLRDATIDDLGIRQGLIAIPSFHVAYATLYMGAAWRIPRLRAVILPLNLVMIAATPVEGSHYLVDMLAGAALALAAAAGARLACWAADRSPWQPSRRPAPSLPDARYPQQSPAN